MQWDEGSFKSGQARLRAAGVTGKQEQVQVHEDVDTAQRRQV